MKLNPAQLGKHLQAGLAPVYVVSGDEPLLCQEAEDAIRAATRQQGFSERTVFHAEASFDWGLLYEAGASLSLFAEKRLIELRIANGKPGDKGTAAILEYLERPPQDTVLLISPPKLDGSTQKTKGPGPDRRPAQPVPADSGRSRSPSWGFASACRRPAWLPARKQWS